MTTANGGLVLGAAGIALMCAMDAVAKALGAEFTTFQVVFVRYLGAALWLGLWILLTRGRWPRLSDIGRHTLRAAMLVVTASLFFYAVTHLPLAIVTALAMTAPLYVTAMGVLLLNERIGPTGAVALALGVSGAAIILFGGGALEFGTTEGELLAWAAALLAPLSYGATLVVLKHHSGRDDPASMTLGQSVIAALLVLPLALGSQPEITARLAGLMTMIGFLGAAGFVLLLHGLRRMPVSYFSVIDYTSLLWAALLGYVFFAEMPGWPFLLGAIFIVSGCSALALGQRPPAREPVV